MQIFNVTLGCDPEFFFKNAKGIVGAESVLPEHGLIAGAYAGSKFIIDGVQAELNPSPYSCRELLANEIGRCFVSLKECMDSVGVTLDMSQTVTVKKKSFAGLSDKSKRFGCSGSKNAYKSEEESKIKVNPMVYRKRSAGGHLHLGKTDNKSINNALDNPKRLVPILDILLGNTCVLIDRDEGNIERRKSYGRAGEYRTPVHGIEYRTLSNFWLRNYQLMSFVFGLARFAVNIVAQDKDKLFLDAVNIKEIEKAINKNDFKLAYKNFLKIEPIIGELTGDDLSGYAVPFTAKNLPLFKHFVNKGADYWFKNQDTLSVWIARAKGENRDGWERFLETTVARDLNESIK